VLTEAVDITLMCEERGAKPLSSTSLPAMEVNHVTEAKKTWEGCPWFLLELETLETPGFTIN
jgi:hypothetical protein